MRGVNTYKSCKEPSMPLIRFGLTLGHLEKCAEEVDIGAISDEAHLNPRLEYVNLYMSERLSLNTATQKDMIAMQRDSVLSMTRTMGDRVSHVHGRQVGEKKPLSSQVACK